MEEEGRDGAEESQASGSYPNLAPAVQVPNSNPEPGGISGLQGGAALLAQGNRPLRAVAGGEILGASGRRDDTPTWETKSCRRAAQLLKQGSRAGRGQ